MGNSTKTWCKYLSGCLSFFFNPSLNTDINDVRFVSEKCYKIILVGDSAVGKSSFVSRVTRNEFHLENKMTIGVEFMSKVFKININKNLSHMANLQFWDTSGQKQYRAIVNAYYRNVDVLIIMFALDNQESFDNIGNWIKDLEYNVDKQSLSKIKIILVGNKSDKINKTKNIVKSDDINKVAMSLNCKYYEVSAMSGFCCQKVVNNILRKIKKDIQNKDTIYQTPTISAIHSSKNCEIMV